MRTKKQSFQIRKTFFALMLIGILFSTFCAGSVPSVRAQDEGTGLLQLGQTQNSEWEYYTDEYLNIELIYPNDWTIQNNPYHDFGWRLSSPDAVFDPLGRPTKGGYISINIIAQSNETDLNTEELVYADITSTNQITISGILASETSGFTQNGNTLTQIVFVKDGYVYRIESVFADIANPNLEVTKEILNSIKISGTPIEYPYENPFDEVQGTSLSFSSIKHAFQAGAGKIVNAYGSGHHTGGDAYAFDLIECNGSTDNCTKGNTTQYVIAPTEIKLIYSGNYNGISGDANDFHIFEITYDSSQRLCMSLAHFYIEHPQFTLGKKVPRATVIGRLSQYPASTPHLHMGLWTTPLSSGCAGGSRTAVPYSGIFKLDGVEYPAGESHQGKSVSSNNYPICAEVMASALSDCWGPPSSDRCPAPSLSSPSDSYVSTSQNVNFNWSALSGCTFSGYTFRVCTSSDVSNLSNCFIDTGESNTSRTQLIESQWNNRDLWWGVKAANAPDGASWATRRFRIEPGSGSSCPNLSGEVKLYDNKDCGGSFTTASGVGLWNMASTFNDKAESMAIPSGWSAKLYLDDNESSPDKCFGSTDTDFWNDHFSNGTVVANQATWMRVYDNSSCTVSSCDASSFPSGYVKCAEEGDDHWCNFSGTKTVYYGADNCFATEVKTDKVECVNESFGGDPLNGVHKACYVDEQCDIPSAPTLVSPANNSVIYDTTPLFDWNTASNSVWYEVLYSPNQDFSNSVSLFDTGTSTLPNTPLNHDTYYWKVRGKNTNGGCNVFGNWSNTWSFMIEDPAQPDDNYEPNDTLETAYIGFGEQKWLNTVDGYGIQADSDWYRITVNSGYTRVKVDLRFTHSEGNINLRLYDSSGTTLKISMTTTDNEYIDYIVPSGGTYYIRVYNHNESNQYNLWWDDLPTPPQSVVINEVDPGNPDSIELYNVGNQTVDLSNWHLIAYTSSGVVDEDYIIPSGFSLAAGAYITIHEVSGTNTATDLFIGSSIVWVSSGAVSLTNGSSGIDFMRFGSSTKEPPLGTSWSGTNPVTAVSTAINSTLGRDVSSTDTDAGNDWCAQLSSLGKVNNKCSPINDDFNKAIDVAIHDNITLDTHGATKNNDDPQIPNCNMNAGKVTVWYKYTPTSNSAISLDTKTSSYDTFIAVWTGTRTNLSPVVCNDDIDHANHILQSAVAFRVQANVTYYIEVGQWDGTNSTSATSIKSTDTDIEKQSVPEQFPPPEPQELED